MKMMKMSSGKKLSGDKSYPVKKLSGDKSYPVKNVTC